jgi:hypothetical protein
MYPMLIIFSKYVNKTNKKTSVPGSYGRLLRQELVDGVPYLPREARDQEKDDDEAKDRENFDPIHFRKKL